MRVDNNALSSTLYVDPSEQRANQGTEKKKNDQPEKASANQYGGNLNLCGASVEDRKKQAQSMAMQLAANVFSNEMKLDEDELNRKKHINELYSEKADCQDTLDSITDQRKKLKEEYGITDGCDEEKDLELLRKRKETEKYPAFELSEDEKKRLDEIDKQGMTPYQKEMLGLDDYQQEYSDRLRDVNKQLGEELGVSHGMVLERLKSHEMVDAKKQGEQLLKAASQDVIGMLMDEAKDTIDDKAAEQKENTEEKKEEAKEEEERIEAAKERADKVRKQDEPDEIYELDDLLEDVKKEDNKSEAVDMPKSLNLIVNELKLTVEDLKGAKVDEKL